MVAAWLTELVRQGRAKVGQNVQVVDSAPTGSPDLDWALARLSKEPERGPYDWLMGLRDHPWEKVAKRLNHEGVLKKTRERLLGLFPVTRYYLVDDTAHNELTERFRRVVVDGFAPDRDCATLVKLLNAARMSTTLSDSLIPEKHSTKEKLRMQRRMTEISEDDTGADPALVPAMEQIESALSRRTRPASGGP